MAGEVHRAPDWGPARRPSPSQVAQGGRAGGWALATAGGGDAPRGERYSPYKVANFFFQGWDRQDIDRPGRPHAPDRHRLPPASPGRGSALVGWSNLLPPARLSPVWQSPRVAR